MTLLLAAAACDPSGTGHAGLSFGPASALYDTPLTATVAGLRSGTPVTLTLTTQDAHGATWSSSATFAADSHGRVTLDSPATGGAYTGADPSGLVDALYPAAGVAASAGFPLPSTWDLTLTARVAGRDVGHATVRRLLTRDVGVTTTTLTVAANGIAGVLAEPAHVAGKGPAVVVWGGSEGGLSTTTYAATLAAHGYPALALAYFDEPGLPRTLADIPMEYFARAVQYLDGRPGVDPAEVAVSGASRGSEAALLLAVERPDLVHAVIGESPSDVVYGSYPGGATAAWTLGGRPVAYAPEAQFGNTHPPQTEAVIPVARIRAPLLLICGEDDQEWPSCNYATAMTQARPADPPEVVTDPDAGHYIDAGVPWFPFPGGVGPGATLPTGGTAVADGRGRATAWPRVLAFVDALR